MKFLVLLSLFSFALKSNCQNLVQNPGFETNTSCPSGISQISNAPFWNVSDQYGTPDLYNNSGACNYLPSNSGLGTNLPHTGNGMAGIYCYRTTNLTREYLVNNFSSSMLVGIPYTVSFWVSLSTASSWSVNNIGVYFSVSDPPCTNTSAPCSATSVLMPVIPQLNVNSTIGSNWVQYSFSFTPSSPFNRITIGRFSPDNASNQIDMPPIGNTAYLLFDDFIVEPLNPLPVSITDLKVNCIAENKRISWISDYEFNNSYYLLERSCDGLNYENIGTIYPTNFPNNNYFFDDYSSCLQNNYYRLSQFDLNGVKRDLGIIIDDCLTSQEISIFPNPVSGIIYINAQSKIEQILLYDLTGKILKDYLGILNYTNKNQEIITDDLPSGTYILSVKQELKLTPSLIKLIIN